MSENNQESSVKFVVPFNKWLAVMIAVVTTIIAVITYLQSDAGNRDDQANRDSKRYSLEAMEKKVSGDAHVNYDYNKAYQAYYEYGLLAQSARATEDEATAKIYDTLQEKMRALTPLLQPPYYDPATGEPDVARYEVDTYLLETTALMEKFTAASEVKNAWDYKANTYIIHLTLLAVALFLFGMATTISNPLPRWVFSGAGLGVTLVAVIWAATLYFKPVPDLRECKTSDGTYAIDAYAQGVGFAYRDMNKEAVASFDKAIACNTEYTNALTARAGAYTSLGDLKAAAADYEKARAAGDSKANTAGELAWVYHMQGRLPEAINMNREALKVSPDEYWIQFDLALSMLANGDLEGSRAEYQKGIDMAAKAVADAKAANAAPPSYLWWGLDDAAKGLDDLTETIQAGGDDPLFKAIAKPDAVVPAAEAEIARLKSTSVGLEYSGKLPSGTLAAKIGTFAFALPVKDDAGEVTDYEEPAESFPNGTDEVAVLFDYEGMTDGQEVIFKVLVDGEEDPSWRVIFPWELGASGSAEKLISLAYSNTAVLKPGTYEVELYIDSQFAQRGFFVIEE